MKTKYFLPIMVLVLAMISIVACVNAITEEGHDETTEMDRAEGKEITFQVVGLEQVLVDAQSRAEVPISELCTNITLALYQGSTRVQKIDQDAEDDHFGRFTTHLPYGSYTLVCLAHSSEGNATTTNPEKISFPSSYVTDTFIYCAEIEVTEESEPIQNLSLTRAVSKFEICMTDKIPEDVTMLEIRYTGGSATVNARTGRGVTNSRQHEEFEVTPGTTANTFGVYTFLFDEEGKLKITITAYDEAGNDVYSRVFEDVPMKRNNITRYQGKFFGKAFDGTITADSTWTHTSHNF